MRSWKPNSAASAKEVRRSVGRPRRVAVGFAVGRAHPCPSRASRAGARLCPPAAAKQTSALHSRESSSPSRVARRVHRRRTAPTVGRDVASRVVSAAVQCAVRHSVCVCVCVCMASRSGRNRLRRIWRSATGAANPSRRRDLPGDLPRRPAMGAQNILTSETAGADYRPERGSRSQVGSPRGSGQDMAVWRGMTTGSCFLHLTTVCCCQTPARHAGGGAGSHRNAATRTIRGPCR